ncbi:NAD-dependent protein deacylase [Halobacillus yeomjeoni]|uniref:NAD-dependent protein deacylase n=1 Tax=Halobacillus yeomjeoni TaxID=311194 RepID=UPI001CD68926|nr:NAD-dependent protein deacylase [Halobacillus yeomjeoni]MCA0983719.1 NAD-dependent protein deacylase [Halobacillus yeomjeoni]
MDNIKTLALHIRSAESIVVLTGAGVSTASGIPDFRSSEGLWTEDESREYFMSTSYFEQEPEDFWKKYKAIFRLKLLKDYKPNLVHRFIKDLEAGSRSVTVITQNVDGLHEAAKSSRIIEYHGTLNTSSCPRCHGSFSLNYVMGMDVPRCDQCRVVLKPDVLLFGDLITAHEDAEKAIREADLMLVMGTSLLVTPFNLLPYTALEEDVTTAILNNEPTDKDRLFDYVIHEDLSLAVDQLTKYL